MASSIGRVGIKGAQEPELELLGKRRKVELQSALAEGIKPEKTRAILDTHYIIKMVGGKLVADDGEPIEHMNKRALVEDKKLAAKDIFFADFLPQRTQHEFDELREWEAMVRGETNFNTLITTSPYGEEFDDGSQEADIKLRRAGQKPYWRRGMFRVAHAQDGELHIFSYSIDNSSVKLMAEAVERRLDHVFEAKNSTDMLGERIPKQIDDDSWRFIASGLVTEADEILSEKNGGNWKHGHNPEAEVREAQSYVESQTQVIDSLMQIDEQLALQHSTFEAYDIAFQNKFYDCLALLETRLDLGRESEPVVDYEAASSGAGAMARAEGKVYDACGLVIGPDQAGIANTGQKTGLESLMRLTGQKVACPECNKKVVIPRGDLANGKLSCKDCGYWLDVCTGKKGFSKGTDNKANSGTASGLELIAIDFKKYDQGAKIKRTAERQVRADLGAGATYLDIKRHEKQLRQQLEQAA